MWHRMASSLVVVLLVAGCAAEAPRISGPMSSDITVRVADGVVYGVGDRLTVPEGTRMHLTVDSDVSDTAHVHGYDIEFAVGPGTRGSADFTTDLTGIFDVELHDSDLSLFELEVR
jgi:hypothetical protein